MKQPQSITSLPSSPDAERHQRVVRYLIAMSIRVACIIACFFVQGWWLLIPLLGAVVLPYVAVILANVGTNDSAQVLRPGSLVSIHPESEFPEARPEARPGDTE